MSPKFSQSEIVSESWAQSLNTSPSLNQCATKGKLTLLPVASGNIASTAPSNLVLIYTWFQEADKITSKSGFC